MDRHLHIFYTKKTAKADEEINIDDIEGLDPYMEIEIALEDGEDYSEAQSSIFKLFEKLGITDGFERTSYLELLEEMDE